MTEQNATRKGDTPQAVVIPEHVRQAAAPYVAQRDAALAEAERAAAILRAIVYAWSPRDGRIDFEAGTFTPNVDGGGEGEGA